MKISDIGEFGLIDKIKVRFDVPDGIVGIGDDCAVIPAGDGDMLVTTDMLVEGVHFLADDISPEQLGWKSAAVNLSDIAAMGGTPVGTFASMALPPNVTVEWAERFIDGYAEISRLCNAPLLGGDTTSSHSGIAINVTALGRCEKGRALLRSSAAVGDVVCVTGSLGDSGGGLQAILAKLPRTTDVARLIERHYKPVPRIDQGRALAATCRVHAMMDVSDGIASDLRHILKASRVGAEIDLALLPISDALLRVCSENGWNASEIAAGAGEDYELLFTAAPEALEEIKVRFTVIGRITDGDGIVWTENGKLVDFNKKGFTHF